MLADFWPLFCFCIVIPIFESSNQKSDELKIDYDAETRSKNRWCLFTKIGHVEQVNTALLEAVFFFTFHLTPLSSSDNF